MADLGTGDCTRATSGHAIHDIRTIRKLTAVALAAVACTNTGSLGAFVPDQAPLGDGGGGPSATGVSDGLTEGDTVDDGDDNGADDDGDTSGEDSDTSGEDGDTSGEDGNTRSEDGNTSGEDSNDGDGSGTDTGRQCDAPMPVTCDDMDDDPWHAIGLNCTDGPQVQGSYTGDPDAIHVHDGDIGTYMPPEYPPLEGDKVVILSTGVAADLLVPGLFASTAHPGPDPGDVLPPLIVSNGVSATEDCFDNPDLVGTGDCSNTIGGLITKDVNGTYDWAELRLTTVVPAEAFGFSYSFAMFSSEYPDGDNEGYIAWLHSEQWTGNVSFDDMGNPISLNGDFLDYTDDAPELQGTAMAGHAGTPWLTTTASVTPGEKIVLVFAVFDLDDNVRDTIVILDDWQWTCQVDPPATVRL